MKMGSVTERKRLRLSMMDVRSTPNVNSEFVSNKNSETSISSEDLLTSTENLFSAHDTIDLSPEMKRVNKDYVRISKQEYEEIKSRVSAIENRLSREFTDVDNTVQPLQQVQNVYEQTLEEVAMLHCPNSEHLARRLSRELQIRPREQAKIIRSPSARKIGTIRRRSKENLTKIVRHKSWNISSHVQGADDRFYPYVGLQRRDRTRTAKPAYASARSPENRLSGSLSANSSMNTSDSSQKYQLRKRISLASDYDLNKTIGRPARRSLNITSNNSWNETKSESSMNASNSTTGGRSASQMKQYQGGDGGAAGSQQKWRSAAAFFMEKTGEVGSSGQTGRPSVNKLRQNAGSVLAKAKLFETSSDKSSDYNKSESSGFARRPRAQYQSKSPKFQAQAKPSTHAHGETRLHSTYRDRGDQSKVDSHAINRRNVFDNQRPVKKTTPPPKKVTSPQYNPTLMRTPQIPALKKTLCTPRNLRTPMSSDMRKAATPMRAVHVSPRRRSPRHKQQRM